MRLGDDGAEFLIHELRSKSKLRWVSLS
jgi:hypothetical protein